MNLVTVIGGANIDINGFSARPLVMGDSNPGTIDRCSGGVARNIAENLARLDVKVNLISAIGNDVFGKTLLAECKALGIKTRDSVFPQMNSSVYLALMDNLGEMAHLRKKIEHIRKSKIIVIDSNISVQAIHFIVSNCADRPLFLDPVSITKAEKVKACIGAFDTIKLNRIEAAAISGLNINGKKNLRRAGEWFIKKGVRRVFITLGAEGVFFYSADEHFFREAARIKAVNVTGTGDAFMAGIVYGSLNGYSNEQIIRFSLAVAGLTVQSRKTVSEKISVTNRKIANSVFNS